MYWVGFGLHAEWEPAVGYVSLALPPPRPCSPLTVREWDIVAAALCRPSIPSCRQPPEPVILATALLTDLATLTCPC